MNKPSGYVPKAITGNCCLEIPILFFQINLPASARIVPDTFPNPKRF